MTAEFRPALRYAIDEARRARIDWRAEPRCAGCGVEATDYALGCRTCWDRRNGRKRRAEASAQLALIP